MSRRVGVALGAVLALLLTSCAGDPITDRALDRAVSTEFGRVYAHQQQLVTGHSLTPSRVLASCARAGGAGVSSDTGASSGAGDDWSCRLTWTPPGAPPATADYDLTVATDGCFSADGPPAQVGRAQLVAADGTVTPNPLAAFDGCLAAFGPAS